MTSNKLHTLSQNSTIGIFGGGQLAKMTCDQAHKLGYKTVIFCDEKDSPASVVASKVIVGSYLDKKALIEFAQICDIITLEFENIPVSAINTTSKITKVFPEANILKITQNRLDEKDFLVSNNIKVTDYSRVDSLSDLEKSLGDFDFKAILKTATMGYDGKGQYVLNKSSDLKEVWKEAGKQELILEKFADFDQEISVMVARNQKAEVSCYEPLTNIHKNGILDQSFYPSKVNQEIIQNAQNIAMKIANNLNLVGIIAIEFFVLKNGELLVNEMAPRPHNSGHFSMDSCQTSQFEQFVRAITASDFGSTKFHSHGYMVNLIGNEVNDLKKYHQNKSAIIHLYGKKEAREGRKMGHVNIVTKKVIDQ